MKRKPLKISWRTWCLYKLAKKDFSVWEMTTAIEKRAAESGQTVDPGPVINTLISEGLLDDEKLVRTKVQLQFELFGKKGPLALKRDFLSVKKIDPDIVDRYVYEQDERWTTLADNIRRKSLEQKKYDGEHTGPIPSKLFDSIYRKLARNGFTKSQIDAALTPVSPEYEKKEAPDANRIEKLVEKRMDMGKGPRDIQQYLRQQNVDESVIKQYLRIPDEVWVELAAREKEKKFGSAPPKSRKEKQKQVDFLLRRGFLYEHINKAL